MHTTSPSTCISCTRQHLPLWPKQVLQLQLALKLQHLLLLLLLQCLLQHRALPQTTEDLA